MSQYIISYAEQQDGLARRLVDLLAVEQVEEPERQTEVDESLLHLVVILIMINRSSSNNNSTSGTSTSNNNNNDNNNNNSSNSSREPLCPAPGSGARWSGSRSGR